MERDRKRMQNGISPEEVKDMGLSRREDKEEAGLDHEEDRQRGDGDG
jgi:hypothetical protein